MLAAVSVGQLDRLQPETVCGQPRPDDLVAALARSRRGDDDQLADGQEGVLDDAGRVETIIAEGRDVTESKAAEAALRASEAKFSGILALAADAIIT